MKPLVCTYCEGNDIKIVVVNKENNKLKVYRIATADVPVSTLNVEEGIGGVNLESDDTSLLGIEKDAGAIERNMYESSITGIKQSLYGLNLNKHLFIPALTEPAVYYHVFEGAKQPKASKLNQLIIEDIRETKNIVVEKESLDYVELSDRSLLSVFIPGEVACINLINSLARLNDRRNYKIPTAKSAEISLAYYVAKRKKFFPDDYSLIVYIGKEYSKLIFLHGRKLKHLGATLDIGTVNLHTYDVYFSKILLEMENGGITSLDNIIVCGEDDSENIILSFYGTFPEANVSRLEFDDLDLSLIEDEIKNSFSTFCIPIAVATDYYDTLSQEHKGIRLLPKSVREEQKFFQFSWHGYAMLPLLFAAAFFITYQILQNTREINRMNTEIEELTRLQIQNQEILTQIAGLETRINSFDQTQAILDSATAGTEVLRKIVEHISDFCGQRQNFWITKIARGEGDLVAVEGYSLSKNVMTEFAYSFESATLNSVTYEMLRDKNAYKFNITFNLSNFPKKE
ncbi:MAG: hypothetical protein HXY49_00430 [Ignavibacteriaceae bacterium]|nr:hypothetical protein [Ignavibacteriaceae bacterium]